MSNFTQIRVAFTLAMLVLIGSLLGWQHFHSGVPSHHILQRADLPELSNWWGLLVLPILSWTLLGRIESRLKKQTKPHNQGKQFKQILALFFLGLTMGLCIIISFTYDYKPFLDAVPFLFLVLSLFVPIYYSEFILGCILGMTYTFGALLPTAFVLILVGLGFLVYRFIRPLILKLILLVTTGNKKV